MSSNRGELAEALTGAMLEGSWDDAGLLRNVALTLGGLPGWAVGVIVAVQDAYRERPADRIRELTAFVDLRLEAVEELLREEYEGEDDFDPETVLWEDIEAVRRFTPEPAMGRMRWPVPAIATRVELAAFFDLHPRELDWLADVRGLNRRATSSRLRHYTVVWVTRAGRAPRPIERPKPLLKDVQRRILHELLARIPPHDAAHGFRRGHSALTNARRHVGREVVVGLDLEDFFASVTASRVYGIFRAAGY